MEERENKKLGTILNYAIIVCIAAILIMIICGIVGKFLDKKTNRIGEFSERHPRLNMVIALALVVIMGTAGYVSIYYIVCKVKEIVINERRIHVLMILKKEYGKNFKVIICFAGLQKVKKLKIIFHGKQ